MPALVFSPPFERVAGGAVGPTTLTLSGSATGVDGQPTTITATLDAPATAPVTVTPAPATGATFSTPAVIGVGQTTTTWTVTRATSGTAAIDATTIPSLTVTGGFTYTSAPAGSLPSITLLTAGAGTYPFSAGQAFQPGALYDGEALNGLQLDVKSRWPDGSVKIGIISGTVAASGTSTALALTKGTAATGATLTTADLKATGIAAAFTTDFGGATWAASSSDWDAPFLAWAAGPLMSSWIYRKDVGTDAHLTAWMEVRLWSTGDVEVLPWIENGYLLVAGPTGKAGAYAFSLGGSSRFSATLPVYHHTRQPLISGSTLSYWLGSDKTVTPKHDADYLASTGLVAKMMSSLARTQYAFDGSGEVHRVSAQFTPYEQHVVGGSTQNTWQPLAMGSGGESASIGTQPAWECVYLSGTNTDGLLFRQLLQESYRFGAYQIHYRDEATNRPIRFSQRADTGLRSEAPKTNVSTVRGNTTTVTPTISGYITDVDEAKSFKWATSHHPAGPLLAYIASGRFWFMEECQHIAAVNYLAGGTAVSTTGGVFDSKDRNDNNLRETAWCLRSLFIAECVTPDDDALKADLSAAVDANVLNYWNKYVSPSASPTPNPYGIVRNNDAAYGDACQAWQHDFFVGSIAKLVAFRGGSSSPIRQKAREFFDWTARSVIGRAGGTGADEFLYRYATTEFPAGETSTAELHPGPNRTAADWDAGTWIADWGDFFDRKAAQYAGSWPRVDGDMAGNYPADGLSHWGRYFEALMLCASLGATGASAAVTKFRTTATRQQWDLGQAGSVWAWQLPVSTGIDSVALALESFAFLPAVGARTNVHTNTASSVDYDLTSGVALSGRWWNGYQGANSFASMVGSYSGSIWAPQYSPAGAIIVHGGGHGGQIGAFAYAFDFSRLRWACIGAPSNVPSTSTWCGYPDARNATMDSGIDQRDLQWLDYSYNGSYIKIADHEYLQNAYVSPAEGGGPRGSLYLPQSTYSQSNGVTDPRPGGTGLPYLWAPHLMNLQPAGVMRRASAATLGNWPSYSTAATVKDTKRHRLWFFKQSSPGETAYHDLTSGPPYTKVSHAMQKASGGGATWAFAANCTLVYVEEADAIVVFWPSNQNSAPPAVPGTNMSIEVYSMDTGVPVDQERRIAAPTAYPMPYGGLYVGATWHQRLKKFYLYEGFGDTFSYTLTPSSLNFKTCSWTWGKESFSGPAPVSKSAYSAGNAQALAVLNKWQYVPAHDCIAWHDGPTTSAAAFDGVTRDGVMQLWRPPGTPI